MSAGNNNTVDKVLDGALGVMDYVTGGFHAIPADNKITRYDEKTKGPVSELHAITLKESPAQHRLYNVLGMAAAFAGAKYIVDIMYGCKVNGAQYEEIKQEEVILPLRPLHGIIKCDHFSDDPIEQIKTAVHRAAPAIVSAVGAVVGSTHFFKQNGTQGQIDKLQKKLNEGSSLSPLEADKLAGYRQGEIARVVAGATAWVGSSSGLTPIYGLFLNTAFFLSNGNKTLAGAADFFKIPALQEIANTFSAEGNGPSKQLAHIVGQTKKFCYEVEENVLSLDVAADKYGKALAESVVKPLFRGADQEKIDEIAQQASQVFHNAYNIIKLDNNGKVDAALVQKAVKNDVDNLMTSLNTDPYLAKSMTIGNNGFLGKAVEFLDVGKNIQKIRDSVKGNSTQNAPGVNPSSIVAGATAVAAAIGVGAVALNSGKAEAALAKSDNLETISGQDYVKSLEAQRNAEKPKGAMGKVADAAKWVGDTALAVVPVHRLKSSIGLAVGGSIGLMAAKLLTGSSLKTGTIVEKDKFPKLLQPLYGKLANNSLSDETLDRLKQLAGKLVFAAGCALGVNIGSKSAYSEVDKKNEKKRESIGDFVKLVRQEHGEKMVPLVTGSSIFGSTAGAFLAPIPGVNYGPSLAARTVSEQDRHITTKGLGFLSGTKTNGLFGIIEGCEDICKYATYNKSQHPEQLELKSLHVLSQIADLCNTELNGQHIKAFVDKVHEVRDKYYQEGGVPKDKQKAMMKDMHAHFADAGLNKTLYECGIDILHADFNKSGGFIGGVAKLMGSEKKINVLQEEFRKTVKEQRKSWVDAPAAFDIGKADAPHNEFTQHVAEVSEGKKSFVDNIPPRKSTTDIQKKSIKPSEPKSSFEEVAIAMRENGSKVAVGV